MIAAGERVSRSGVSAAILRRGCGACCALVIRNGDTRQWLEGGKQRGDEWLSWVFI
jgi:hypothetical protein